MSEVDNDLVKERFEHEHLSTTISDLKKHLTGIDVEAIKRRLDELSEKSTQTISSIERCRISRDDTRNKAKALSGEILHDEKDLREAQVFVTDARDELAVVLPPGTDDVDHYVFNIKRASQIKDLPSRISDAVAKQASTAERLVRGSDGVMSNRFASRNVSIVLRQLPVEFSVAPVEIAHRACEMGADLIVIGGSGIRSGFAQIITVPLSPVAP